MLTFPRFPNQLIVVAGPFSSSGYNEVSGCSGASGSFLTLDFPILVEAIQIVSAASDESGPGHAFQVLFNQASQPPANKPGYLGDPIWGLTFPITIYNLWINPTDGSDVFNIVAIY